MKSAVIFVLSILFSPAILFSENYELNQVWQKAFGGDKDDAGYSVDATSDGGFVVAGVTRSMGEGKTDAIVLKLDSKGRILWSHTFGKERKDIFEAVVQTSGGQIVAAGNSKSYSQNGSYDVYVVKLDQDGKTLWKKSFGGDGKDYAKAICKADNGSIVIAGTTKSFGKGSYDFLLVKLDKNGSIVWTRTYGGEDLDIAYAVERTSDGGYIVAGETESFGADNTDYYIVKVDAFGKEEWTKRFGGKKADALYGIKEIKDGYAFVGESRSFDSDKRDLSVLKIDKSSEVMFHKLFGLKNHEYARAIELTKSGNFLVAGVTKSMGQGRADFYLLELNSTSGNLNWADTYGGKKNDYARDMTRGKNGDIVIVGDSKSFTEDGYNFHMIKLSEK